MQIDTATKGRRSVEEETTVKKDGNGENIQIKVTTAPRTETDAERSTRGASEMLARDFPPQEEGITAKKLQEAWPETAATAAAAQQGKPQENTSQEQQNQEQKIRELTALVEMSLGGEELDRYAESRKASFKKSIICDAGELQKDIKIFEDSDEGRLLIGLDKSDEIHFFAVLTYIRRWCQAVHQGIPTSLCDVYEKSLNMPKRHMRCSASKDVCEKY